MINFDELIGLIQNAVNADKSKTYSVPYLGIVTSLTDPDGLNRVIVQVPALGWTTNDSAAKCAVIDTKGYTLPEIDDYVIVQFLAGDRNRPVILGTANNMKNMIPDAYADGKDVLYSRNGKIKITYDGDQLEIGNSLFQPAARQEDQIQSTIVEDSVFWTWLAAAGLILAGLGLAAPIPTTLTGKITAGSNQVKIGNK